MHYKNGRAAQNGDHVICKSYNGNAVAGVVFDLVAAENTCNCSVAVTIPGGVTTLTCRNTAEMYHVHDALGAAEQFYAAPPVPVGTEPQPAAAT